MVGLLEEFQVTTNRDPAPLNHISVHRPLRDYCLILDGLKTSHLCSK